VETYHANGIVDIPVGETWELKFDGAPGNLLSRTYYLGNPQLSNRTRVTLDPFLRLQILGLRIPGLGSIGPVFDKEFASTGLLGFNVFNDTWALGGFDPVRFENSFGPIVSGGAPLSGTDPIPEPATFLLVAASLAVLHRTRRRRARRRIGAEGLTS